MNISLVVACARNRIIGNQGRLPWHLPADLAHFKKVTLGKPVIMGRKTWDTLLVQPLPERENIVLTQNVNLRLLAAKVVHSISDIESLVKERECMVIGGAQVYRMFLPLANKIYLTQIDAKIAGDSSFPEYQEHEWQLADESFYAADGNNAYNLKFMVLQRIA